MPSIKGTASISSCSAQTKLLRTTKFPSIFHKKVDARNINLVVMTRWIEKRIESILGFEDEIVSNMAVNLFLPTKKSEDCTFVPGSSVSFMSLTHQVGINRNGVMDVDPRRAQLDLAGFLGDNEAALFVGELWEMLLDAQMQPDGVPRVLVQSVNYDIKQKKNDCHPPDEDICDDDILEESGRSKLMSKFVIEAEKRAEAARKALAPKPCLNRSYPIKKNQPP